MLTHSRRDIRFNPGHVVFLRVEALPLPILYDEHF